MEFTETQARLASGFDEVASAAMSYYVSTGDMECAWNRFVANLTPAQEELPFVAGLINAVEKEGLDLKDALGLAGAAGKHFSVLMGETVTTSLTEISKVIIDAGDDLNIVLGNVNGQIVNLGTVNDITVQKIGATTSEIEGFNESLVNTATVTEGTVGVITENIPDSTLEFHNMGSAIEGVEESANTALAQETPAH